MSNLNVNLQNQVVQECFKTIENWGHTVYQNICNGTESIVSWGQLDWFLAVFILIILGIVIGGLIIWMVLAILERFNTI